MEVEVFLGCIHVFSGMGGVGWTGLYTSPVTFARSWPIVRVLYARSTYQKATGHRVDLGQL